MDRASSIAVAVLRTLTLEQYGTLRADQLLERFIRQRDETAFRVLVERYGSVVLRRC